MKRPDGIYIVENATDINSGNIIAPINVSADLKCKGDAAVALYPVMTYPDSFIWPGASNFHTPGDADSTCDNWSDNGGLNLGRFQFLSDTDITGQLNTCDFTLRIY